MPGHRPGGLFSRSRPNRDRENPGHFPGQIGAGRGGNRGFGGLDGTVTRTSVGRVSGATRCAGACQCHHRPGPRPRPVPIVVRRRCGRCLRAPAAATGTAGSLVAIALGVLWWPGGRRTSACRPTLTSLRHCRRLAAWAPPLSKLLVVSTPAGARPGPAAPIPAARRPSLESPFLGSEFRATIMRLRVGLLLY